MKLILDIEKFETIENLYIELLFIQNFIPPNLLGIFSQFICVTQLLGAITLIQNNGFEVQQNEEEEEGDDSDEDDEIQDEEVISNLNIRDSSKVDQID